MKIVPVVSWIAGSREVIGEAKIEDDLTIVMKIDPQWRFMYEPIGWSEHFSIVSTGVTPDNGGYDRLVLENRKSNFEEK